MIEQISLSNYLFFQNLTIELDEGINIFTGETGAGKSIIVDAISLALGDRPKGDIFRNADKPVCLTITFAKYNNAVQQILEEQDIEIDNLIIRRIIHNNHKSKYYICDTPCSYALVKEIAYHLVEKTSQGEALKLCSNTYHMEIVNSLLNKNDLMDLASLYNSWRQYNKTLHQQKQQIETNLREKDYLEFIQEELVTLSTYEKEEEELLEKIKLLKNHQNVLSIIEKSSSYAVEIQNNIMQISKLLHKSSDFFHESRQFVDAASIQMEEFTNKISEAKQQFSNLNNLSIESLEDRLYKLRDVARKHRVQPFQLNIFLSDVENKLSALDNSEEILIALEKQTQQAYIKYKETAEKISLQRTKAICKLQAQLNEELKQLAMPHALFEMTITHLPEEKYNINGIDEVVFKVRTNPGHPFSELSKVASGGELSRLLLALKAVCSDNRDTLFIFDEIDTGISGATSTAVGKKLAQISSNNQLIIITHQPQIAVFANSHFLVTKSSDGTNTHVDIQPLNEGDKINEVARMLSGDKLTIESINAAQQLYSQSAA